MKKFLLYLTMILFPLMTFAQNTANTPKADWNGYIQLRATSNFNGINTIMVRRLKLWLKSTPEFSDHWYYKLQITLSSLKQEKFFLQDVKIGYKTGLFSFDFGQFVPQYSLQRFQPDYKIPAIERAKVIKALIPDGTLGVRDIGMQANFHTKNDFLQTHLGIFNGYGIKNYRFDWQGYMITHKTQLNIPIKNSSLKLGYSLQLRQAEKLQIPKVLPDTVLFTGKDFRYNLFAMFKSRILQLQAEYLAAYLNKQKADGYYFLSVINLNQKNQLVFGYERYKDLIASTSDKPFFRLGYDYEIKIYKTKISFDNFFQLTSGKIYNYFAAIQLQLFLK